MIPTASPNDIKARLDLHMIEAYRSSSDIRRTRDYVLRKWRSDEALSRLALSSQTGLSGICASEDEAALRNVVDYFFEPYFVSTMNIGQAWDYFHAIQQVIGLEISPDGPNGNGPVLLRTLHHHSIFSMIVVVIARIVRESGYRKAILLHQNLPLDPRLEAARDCVNRVLGLEVQYVHLKGRWLSTLRRETDARTIVICMDDMPPGLYETHHRPGRTPTRIELYAKPGIDLSLEGISAATILAKLIKASQYTLDFPDTDRALLQAYDPATGLRCPLPAWIFWPGLKCWERDEIPASLEITVE